MKLLRAYYSDRVIRKVYGKKGVNTFLFNMPLKFAKSQQIKIGDYISIEEVKEGILIKKLEVDYEK